MDVSANTSGFVMYKVVDNEGTVAPESNGVTTDETVVPMPTQERADERPCRRAVACISMHYSIGKGCIDK